MKFLTNYGNAVVLYMMLIIVLLFGGGSDHYSVKAHQAVSSSLLPHDHHRLEMTLRRFHSPHQEEFQEEIKQTFHNHVKQFMSVITMRRRKTKTDNWSDNVVVENKQE